MSQFWSFVGASSLATGSSISVSIPSGVMAGDLLVMVVSDSTGAIPSVSGWTEIGPISSSNGPKSSVFYKMASASESAVSISGLDSDGTGLMVAYRNILKFDTSSASAGDSASITTNSIITSATDDLIISVFTWESSFGTVSFNAPPSTNVRANYSSIGLSNQGVIIVDENQSSIGSSTQRTATMSAGGTHDTWVAFALAFKQNANAGNMLLMFR